jgi:hypothetical protein
VGLTEVGAFPLVALVAVVAGTTALAAGGLYAVQKASEIIDRHLRRREETKKYVANIAAAVDINMRHAEAEERTGRMLPLTDAEKRILDMLEAQGKAIASSKEAPLPGPDLPNFSGVGAIALPALLFGAGFFVLTQDP